MKTIPQTGVLVGAGGKTSAQTKTGTDVEIASHHETCLEDKLRFAANFKVIEQESNKVQARRIVQQGSGTKPCSSIRLIRP